MGCCFSTSRTQKQNPDDQNGLKNQQPQLRFSVPKSNATHEVDRRAPPPPPVEEESVKEVLSETPISKPQVPILLEERETQMPIVQPQAEKFETKGSINKAEEVSEVSQVSEVCSMSGSFSTATTATTATITEKREDEATSKRCSREGSQKWNRSPSDASRKRPYTVDGNSTGGRERRVKSPARRPEPSPEKKSQGSSRSIRGRESGQVGTRKLNVGSPGVRRDSGEGSGRRSRSPSSTRTVSGGSKVSAGGVRSQLKPSGGAGQKLPPAKGAAQENSVSEKVEEQNDGVQQEESIDLENPNISLECFIFL